MAVRTFAQALWSLSWPPLWVSYALTTSPSSAARLFVVLLKPDALVDPGAISGQLPAA